MIIAKKQNLRRFALTHAVILAAAAVISLAGYAVSKKKQF